MTSTTNRPKVAVTLDNRSTPCAVGLIRAAQTMRTLKQGEVLEIWSRDRFAPMEVPIWADRERHTIITQVKTGRWPRRYWLFQVEHR